MNNELILTLLLKMVHQHSKTEVTYLYKNIVIKDIHNS